MRRAAVSVSANIAEGFKRKGIKDKINFYNIAQSSLSELESYLLLSADLKYITSNNQIGTLAKRLVRYLPSDSPFLERAGSYQNSAYLVQPLPLVRAVGISAEGGLLFDILYQIPIR